MTASPAAAEPDKGEISLDDQIRCVGREIGLRRAVYPRFVLSGKLTHDESKHQLACMEAVYATLKRLKDSRA